MIDNETFRLRIGLFSGKRFGKSKFQGNASSAYNYIHNYNTRHNPGNYYSDYIYILFIYYILGIACVSMAMCQQFSDRNAYTSCSSVFKVTHTFNTNMHIIHTKLLSALCVAFLITRIYSRGLVEYFTYIMKLKWSCPKIKQSNRGYRILSCICFWTFFINSMLIVIVNPSLLNPGPANNTNPFLSISY